MKKKKMRRFDRRLLRWVLCGMLLFSFCGCGKGEVQTKVVLTTGFNKDEIFRIETMSCTLPFRENRWKDFGWRFFLPREAGF